MHQDCQKAKHALEISQMGGPILLRLSPQDTEPPNQLSLYPAGPRRNWFLYPVLGLFGPTKAVPIDLSSFYWTTQSLVQIRLDSVVFLSTGGGTGYVGSLICKFPPQSWVWITPKPPSFRSKASFLIHTPLTLHCLVIHLSRSVGDPSAPVAAVASAQLQHALWHICDCEHVHSASGSWHRIGL